LEKLIKDLKAVEGVKVYEIDRKSKNLKIGLSLPNGKELPIILETEVIDGYIDLKKAPKITPQNFLKVAEVLGNYGYALPNYRYF
nr:hypothetical protein [Candidatus Woesearchaeota archaeon]